MDAPVSSRSLLLVDPDPSVRALLTGLLKRDDRRIEAASDGIEALEQLRHSPFDVVVAGQGRNGDDGLKLVRKVRSIQPETPVIVTGEQDPQRVVGAIRQRAYSYVHRPIAEGPINEMVSQ